MKTRRRSPFGERRTVYSLVKGRYPDGMLYSKGSILTGVVASVGCLIIGFVLLSQGEPSWAATCFLLGAVFAANSVYESWWRKTHQRHVALTSELRETLGSTDEAGAMYVPIGRFLYDISAERAYLLFYPSPRVAMLAAYRMDDAHRMRALDPGRTIEVPIAYYVVSDALVASRMDSRAVVGKTADGAELVHTHRLPKWHLARRKVDVQELADLIEGLRFAEWGPEVLFAR